MSEIPLISVVLPLYNEVRNVMPCWRALEPVMRDSTARWQIVLVDDGSVDGTWDAIGELLTRSADVIAVKAIRLSRNFGKEAAVLAGLNEARGDAVIVMDADLQHPPALLPRLLEYWQRGEADIVEAVKQRRQPEGWWSRLAARSYYALFRLASGLDLRNSTDFKLLDRKVVDQYLALPESGRFFRGLTAWLGFRSVAVAFEPPPRTSGASRWGIGSLLGMARHTIISFSSLPLRLLTSAGLLGIGFSVVLTVQTLWYHWMGLAEEGFPTVILLILGLGSLILFGIGLIGEYVAEIYVEVKRRPAYVVSERLEASTEA